MRLWDRCRCGGYDVGYLVGNCTIWYLNVPGLDSSLLSSPIIFNAKLIYRITLNELCHRRNIKHDSNCSIASAMICRHCAEVTTDSLRRYIRDGQTQWRASTT